MTELSSPDSETIVVGPSEPPILPVIRTSTWPFVNRKLRASSDNSRSDVASGTEIANTSSPQPVVSAQSPDSRRNSKKPSRDDQDDDEKMTRPTTRLCIEAPPPSSPADKNTTHAFAPILTPSGRGEGTNHNCSSKKRSRDIKEDEGEVVRYSPKRRQEPPTVRPRYPSPTPSDRRIGRIIAPFGKSFRFNPRSPSPEADNGPLGVAGNEGNSADNSMASSSGALTEVSRKE